MNASIDLDAPGNLYECSQCYLFFRHPVLSPAQLVRLYRRLPDDLWSGLSTRVDYDLARSVISKNFSSGKVLDVGCFRGDFLASLSEEYEKFGVEPSESAQQIAIGRGIKIIASAVEEIEIGGLKFNVIVLTDVIEHLVHPLEALEKLESVLLPGGVIIISTGNTDVLPWRLLRNEYWYYFLDHVSFFNRAWFEWTTKRLPLQIQSIKPFSHPGSRNVTAPWLELMHTIFYRLTGPKWMLYRVACRFFKLSGYPVTSSWQDHLLVVLRKPMSEFVE
jgi:SAM-dependent methyltransferase